MLNSWTGGGGAGRLDCGDDVVCFLVNLGINDDINVLASVCITIFFLLLLS